MQLLEQWSDGHRSSSAVRHTDATTWDTSPVVFGYHDVVTALGIAPDDALVAAIQRHVLVVVDPSRDASVPGGTVMIGLTHRRPVTMAHPPLLNQESTTVEL